jgi:flagellar basal-body rod protein FlgC
MQAMEISRTALDVEWRRLEVISQNLANAGTARLSNGTLYRPLHLVSGPRSDFAAYLHQGAPNAAKADAADPQALTGVAVYAIEASDAPPRLVHEPGNPQADAQGFVAYPAIDQAEQMTLMLKTSRSYEANIVALNAARQMYSKALELGAHT